IAYLASVTLRAVSAIFEGGCGALGAFGQHLLDVFIRRVEEPIKGSVLRRVVFPQSEIPLLAREDQANEHNLDYVDMGSACSPGTGCRSAVRSLRSRFPTIS